LSAVISAKNRTFSTRLAERSEAIYIHILLTCSLGALKDYSLFTATFIRM